VSRKKPATKPPELDDDVKLDHGRHMTAKTKEGLTVSAQGILLAVTLVGCLISVGGVIFMAGSLSKEVQSNAVAIAKIQAEMGDRALWIRDVSKELGGVQATLQRLVRAVEKAAK